MFHLFGFPYDMHIESFETFETFETFGFRYDIEMM